VATEWTCAEVTRDGDRLKIALLVLVPVWDINQGQSFHLHERGIIHVFSSLVTQLISHQRCIQ
jgi:hypothetical protein